MAGPDTAFRSISRKKRLQTRLLEWYRKNHRKLPWRENTDSYPVLVSEFMLQQTQVSTVLPHFRTFLDRFPTASDLARASEESVRAAWSGLGYYRRARYLQAAAVTLVREHGGTLPADLDALRSLPGVGDYTAAALGSIVHGIPKAVVDGNVIRVLTRLEGIRENVSRTAVRKRLQELGDRLLDPGTPGDWNQAVMELGATVCLPRNPGCDRCPWAFACTAARDGNPERYPIKDPPARTVSVTRVVGVLRRRDRVLLTRRRDPDLLDGTWEFPGIDCPRGQKPQAALRSHLEELLGARVRTGSEVARIRHAITFRKITVLGLACSTAKPVRARKDHRAWVTPREVSELPVSSMTTKLIRALDQESLGL